MESASTKSFPYILKYLHHDLFEDFTHVCNVSPIRPGRTAGDLTVTDLRCIRYTPDKRFHLSSITTMNHTRPFPWVETNPAGIKYKNHNHCIPALKKIKKKKYQHLQSLKAMIQVHYHPVYDNLLM